MFTSTIYHPWSYQVQRRGRECFNSDVEYFRHWANLLNLPFSARLRLEWMIFYQTAGKRNGETTVSHFGISRKTFMKWKVRFNPKDLTSLTDQSRAPKRKRIWTVTGEEEANVISLRKNRIKWGKEKLKREYLKQYHREISTNKIQKSDCQTSTLS